MLHMIERIQAPPPLACLTPSTRFNAVGAGRPWCPLFPLGARQSYLWDPALRLGMLELMVGLGTPVDECCVYAVKNRKGP
jgi:hypothetical protein